MVGAASYCGGAVYLSYLEAIVVSSMHAIVRSCDYNVEWEVLGGRLRYTAS